MRRAIAYTFRGELGGWFAMCMKCGHRDARLSRRRLGEVMNSHYRQHEVKP